MKPSLSVLFAGVAAATLAITAAAYSTGAGKETRPEMRPMDCAKAPDRARCEALNKDIKACRDKTGDDWRECMHRPVPAVKVAPPRLRDCTKARNKPRCEAHNEALQACKGKDTRVAHRKCMAEQLSARASKNK